MLLYYDKYYDVFEFGSEILFDMGERRLKKRRKGSAGNINMSGAHISVSASEWGEWKLGGQWWYTTENQWK